MNPTYNKIQKLIDKHAQKAHLSEYDRSVCIQAIAAAREAIMSISPDDQSVPYKTRVEEKLSVLYSDYNDPDGEYTNGKGVIGDLLFDIQESTP